MIEKILSCMSQSVELLSIENEWQEAFTPLPMAITGMHLFESIGNLKYEPCWSYPLKPPFKEIEHTADIAFMIYGEDLEQLFRHAFIALAFKFPPLMNFFYEKNEIKNVDDVVMALNRAVSKADEHFGCPFKAVSFHGEINKEQDQALNWEMIVDV